MQSAHGCRSLAHHARTVVYAPHTKVNLAALGTHELGRVRHTAMTHAAVARIIEELATLEHALLKGIEQRVHAVIDHRRTKVGPQGWQD